ALKGYVDEPAPDRQRTKIALDVITADHIENDIDSFAVRCLLHDLDEILIAVVDSARCSESFACRALLRRTRSGEDLMTACRAKLDGRRADPARTAMDQHPVAGPEPRGIEQIGPDREIDLRQRGSRNEIDAPWNGQNALDRRGAEFGVTAAGKQGTDLFANALVCNALAQFRDRSRYL